MTGRLNILVSVERTGMREDEFDLFTAFCIPWIASDCVVVRLAGLEPAAHSLGNCCSIHLSYRRKLNKVNYTTEYVCR